MSEGSQDSLDLFADTLTITLASVMFIVLLLILSSESNEISEEGFTSLPLKSARMEEQLTIANADLNVLDKQLSELLANNPKAKSYLKNWEEHAYFELLKFIETSKDPFTKSLLAENQKLLVLREQVPWIRKTIVEHQESIRSKLNDSINAVSAHSKRASLLQERKANEESKINYLLLKHGKIYPVTGGPLQTILQKHIKWKVIESKNREDWELQEIPKMGLTVRQAKDKLLIEYRELDKNSTASSQIFLLAYEDSFPETKRLLKFCLQTGIRVSWRPYAMNQTIKMSQDGLSPRFFLK